MLKYCAPMLALALAACVSAAARQDPSAGNGADPIAPISNAATTPYGDDAGRVSATSSPVLAQGSCASTINSCNNISPNQRCHATEHVVYTRSGSLWCKTPIPCTCP